MEKTNKTYVIGTLKDLEVRRDEKDGKNYIAGKFTVHVSETNQVEHKFFSYELTKKDEPNKRYRNYNDLEGYVDRRVKITGEIGSRAFYNTTEGQVIPFTEVNAGFVNLAKDTEPNVATFELGGYVIKPIHERMNKEEKLIAYEMEVGQSDYSGNNLRVIKLTVKMDNTKMVNNIETHYTKGTTIFVNGEINYNTTIEEVVEEVMFGKPIVKHFPKTIKAFEIVGGKQPIVSGEAYSKEQISQLEKSYQEYLLNVEEEGKTRVQSGESTVNNNPDKSGAGSLL